MNEISKSFESRRGFLKTGAFQVCRSGDIKLAV